MAGLALTSATRRTAFLTAAVFFLLGVAAVATSPAQAAKSPCWEQVIDDWLDNGRIDGVYAIRCLEDARHHLPEDIRAYSDIEEKIDAAIQDGARVPQGTGGGGGTTPTSPQQPNLSPGEGEELTRKAGDERDAGPIKDALNAAGPKSADSIPLPLIVLSGLALLLMAAGAAGFAQRKLAARRIHSR